MFMSLGFPDRSGCCETSNLKVVKNRFGLVSGLFYFGFGRVLQAPPRRCCCMVAWCMWWLLKPPPE